MAGGTYRVKTGTVPPIPPAGTVTQFVDSADNKTKQIDSSGAITDLTAGSGVYDGTDTLANILALDPADHLDEIWWATDVKIKVEAINNVAGSPVWQQAGVIYDGTTDTFELPETQDGQTQNLGQENFINVVNATAAPTTPGAPEVFLGVADSTQSGFIDVVRPVSTDLSEGSVYGVNTTEISAGGTGKLATYGAVRDVDTSAWAVGTILYLDGAVAGQLTSTPPITNIYNIAVVLKQDASTGVIFVNTVSSNRVDAQVLPGTNEFLFLTADEITIIAGTFYLAELNDEGIIPTATQAVVVPDDSIVAAAQDHITLPVITDLHLSSGLREGQIEYEVDGSGGQERIYFEVYEADPDGAPVDSGILINPIGDLGVRPIVTMVTPLLDTSAASVEREPVRGFLSMDYTISAGDRLRVHILCEKVGSAGPAKDFTLYFGSDHESYLKSLTTLPLEFTDLTDTPDDYIGQSGKAVAVTDAELGVEFTDKFTEWVYPWVGGTYPDRTMTRVGEYTTISNKETSDYPAPTPVGDPSFLMDAAVFTPLANTSVVYSGHSYSFTEAGWVTQLRVWVPVLSGTTNYRIVIIDNTDPANPIFTTIPEPVLTAGDWTVVAANNIIVVPGSELILYIDALDSGSSSGFSGGWEFNGTSNAGAPSDMGWNRNNQNTLVRVDKDDLDTVDRSTELAGVVAGSTLQFVDTITPTNFREYETTGAPVDQGLYFEYPVQLINSGGSITVGDAATLTATIPVPSSTQYAADAAFWTGNDPAFADVTGFLQFDGVTQGGNDDTGFGVDMRFQQANMSEDWDIVAISGGSGGSGGGVEEAPVDGTPYVRQDAGWISESTGGVPEAPIDGTFYSRKDGAWDNQLTSIESSSISMMGSRVTLNAGEIRTAGLWLSTAADITTLVLAIEQTNANSSIEVGIYEYSGVGQVFDLMGSGTSAISNGFVGTLQVTMSSPITILSPDIYYIGFIIPNGSQSPQFAGHFAGGQNLLAGFNTSDTGITSLPSSVTQTTGSNGVPWVGVK